MSQTKSQSRPHRFDSSGATEFFDIATARNPILFGLTDRDLGLTEIPSLFGLTDRDLGLTEMGLQTLCFPS